MNLKKPGPKKPRLAINLGFCLGFRVQRGGCLGFRGMRSWGVLNMQGLGFSAWVKVLVNVFQLELPAFLEVPWA